LRSIGELLLDAENGALLGLTLLEDLVLHLHVVEWQEPEDTV
jgi:hypothetical protein